LGEALFGRQPLDVPATELRGLRRCQGPGFLEGGDGRGSKPPLLPTGRVAQEIGAPAQVGDQLCGAGIALQPTKRDQAADIDRNPPAAHADKLPRQQRRSQPGMDQPGGLEPRAVVPPEKNRQDRRPGMADEAADGGAPGRIGNLEAGQFQVRDLPGREHEQHAAVLEPAHGFPHGADIDARRAAAAEQFDRDGQIPQLGDAIQENVRHDFHVRPAAQENVRQNDALNPSEGMVADDYGRTLPGNVL